MCLCYQNAKAQDSQAQVASGQSDSSVGGKGYSSAKTRFIHARRLSVDDGLSQATVSAITSDRDGFVWLATQDGLNRFDGVSFKTFYHDFQDAHSIAGNDIRCIHEDLEGNLWLCVFDHGISRYQKKQAQFENFDISKQTHRQQNNRVLDIAEDKNGDLWLATLGGLVQFDRKNQAFQLWRKEEANYAITRAVQLLNQTQLLVATRSGLLVFDINQKTFLPLPKGLSKLKGVSLASLWKEHQDYIWISGFSNGLWRWDLKKDQLVEIEPAEKGPTSKGPVRVIHIDTSKHVWFGSRTRPLYVHQLSTGRLQQVRLEHSVSALLETINPTAIHTDPSGMLWIGDWGKGVLIHNPATRSVQRLKLKGSEPLPVSNIWSATADPSGHLYFAGAGRGLLEYEPDSGRFRHLLADSEVSNLWSMAAYGEEQIALGTFYDGVKLYHRSSGRLESLPLPPGPASQSRVHSILSLTTTQDKHLLVGSRVAGAYEYLASRGEWKPRIGQATRGDSSASKKPFEAVYQIFQDSKGRVLYATDQGLAIEVENPPGSWGLQKLLTTADGLPSNLVVAVREDRLGQLWVGTDNGLVKLVNDQPKRIYTIKDGLKNHSINDLQIDCLGNVWLATNQGLSRIKPSQNEVTIENFGVAEGVTINEFNFGASTQDQNCNLYFGGMGGIIRIDPQLSTMTAKSRLAIVDYLESYHPVDSVLNPDCLETFWIDYKVPVVSFKFRLLNYANPAAHRFSYRLDDQAQWYDIGNRRQIDLTNLTPGTHQLWIRATAGPNTPETVRLIRLQVETPPWQRWYALLAYFLVFVSLLVFYGYRQKRKLLQQKQIAQRERDIAERLRQADKFKDQLLINTSHELKTPLNAIIGLAQLMADSEHSGIQNKEHLYQLELIKNSGEHLLALVNDLLDMSNISQGRIRLNIETFDICLLIRQSLEAFRSVNQKPITYSVSLVDEHLQVVADPDRVLQILNNLLANATKFTEQGEIQVRLTSKDGMAWISVSDTGCGIPETHIEQVFDRFHQVDTSDSRKHQGFGLGLAICKELIALQGGQISLQSTEQVGTCVTFSLPLAKAQ